MGRGPVLLLAVAAVTLTGCAASNGTASAGVSSSSSTTTTSASSTTTTTEAAAETEPAYTPTPEDFKIGVKIRKKQCFGSAGCNVTFRINPSYVGPEDLDGSWSVTYEVHGGEDGPQINTFTIDDGQASFDSEEMVSTSSSRKKLTAKVTDVTSED